MKSECVIYSTCPMWFMLVIVEFKLTLTLEDKGALQSPDDISLLILLILKDSQG